MQFQMCKFPYHQVINEGLNAVSKVATFWETIYK